MPEWRSTTRARPRRGNPAHLGSTCVPGDPLSAVIVRSRKVERIPARSGGRRSPHTACPCRVARAAGSGIAGISKCPYCGTRMRSVVFDRVCSPGGRAAPHAHRLGWRPNPLARGSFAVSPCSRARVSWTARETESAESPVAQGGGGGAPGPLNSPIHRDGLRLRGRSAARPSSSLRDPACPPAVRARLAPNSSAGTRGPARLEGRVVELDERE